MSDKELLISQAIEAWGNYGKAINKSFGFNNFHIDGTPLQNILDTEDQTKIEEFIKYVKDRIRELQDSE